MDVSFALQALGIEQLVVNGGALGPGVHAVSPAVDREVGRLKLAALGVEIDEPTDEQTEYLSSWGASGHPPPDRDAPGARVRDAALVARAVMTRGPAAWPRPSGRVAPDGWVGCSDGA